MGQIDRQEVQFGISDPPPRASTHSSFTRITNQRRLTPLISAIVVLDRSEAMLIATFRQDNELRSILFAT